MVDVDRLRGLMAQNRLTQADVAEYMGISINTFYRKMKKRKFDTDDCEKLIELLHITDPSIFFETKVNYEVTTRSSNE